MINDERTILWHKIQSEKAEILRDSRLWIAFDTALLALVCLCAAMMFLGLLWIAYSTNI